MLTYDNQMKEPDPAILTASSPPSPANGPSSGAGVPVPSFKPSN